MKMRQIIFPANTHRATQENVEALAWATNRRGSRVWTSNNVKAQINKYLSDHGYQSKQDWQNTLKWLEQKGYVTAQYGPGHKRRIKVQFKDDVILSGYSPKRGESKVELEHTDDPTTPSFTPKPVEQVEKKLDEVHWGQPPSKNGSTEETVYVPPTPRPELPPLPEQFVVPEHWAELTTMLLAWAKTEPTVYEEWQAALIDWLRERNTKLTAPAIPTS